MKKLQTINKFEKIIIITFSLIGGLHNLSGSLVELLFSNLERAHGATGGFVNLDIGIMAVLFAALTIIAIFFVDKNPKAAGWMLIIGAIGGLISVSIFYILSFILVLLAGVMCLTFDQSSIKNSR